MTQHTPDGFAVDGRIAEVLGGTRFEGYLHVTVPELVRSRITYVDMVFARHDPGEPDHWRYEDRADPGTASAQEELAAARLDWYGEQFGLRWLKGTFLASGETKGPFAAPDAPKAPFSSPGPTPADRRSRPPHRARFHTRPR